MKLIKLKNKNKNSPSERKTSFTLNIAQEKKKKHPKSFLSSIL